MTVGEFVEGQIRVTLERLIIIVHLFVVFHIFNHNLINMEPLKLQPASISRLKRLLDDDELCVVLHQFNKNRCVCCGEEKAEFLKERYFCINCQLKIIVIKKKS
jgi:hypothetical protein